jgi:hypothetical protein
MEVEWSASCPGCFTPWERGPDSHWIGGRVGPRADLEAVEKRKFLTLPGLKLRPLGSPASCYTDYAILAPFKPQGKLKNSHTILLATCFILVSCLAYSSTLKTEATCSSEKPVDFNGLYGVMSQKTDLILTNAVKTSDPTKLHTTTCRVR